MKLLNKLSNPLNFTIFNKFESTRDYVPKFFFDSIDRKKKVISK